MNTTQQQVQVESNVLDELFISKQTRPETISKHKSSLARLEENSKHIEMLFSSRTELLGLRFDELQLLHDIRELVEVESKTFENINEPSLYRREIRSRILPKYLSVEFLHKIQEKVIAALLNSSLPQKDQDALMTAIVFLQSHTDLGIECQDNPLWEIIFNLSIRDGIRFVDSLTALIEGLDSIREKNQEIIEQGPFLLQKTMQISQWPVFWKHLAEYNKNTNNFDDLSSALLRGELKIDIFFDEIIHLPVLLYRQFKDVLSDNTFFEDQLSDEEKYEISKQVFENILECARLDLPALIPELTKRLKTLQSNTSNNNLKNKIKLLIQSLKNRKDDALNIFLLTLIVAKISIKKYWQNKRDFLFFCTVLKDPENPRNYYEYGQILYKLKHLYAVENVFKCAINIHNDSFWGYWGLGNFYLKKNRLEESEIELNKALKIVQHHEIQTPGELRRELFLLKDDIQSLRRKKIKQQVKQYQQVDLFAA